MKRELRGEGREGGKEGGEGCSSCSLVRIC